MSAHVTSNTAVAAGALEELALNDTSPPSTNLPLPRELRDQIYCYLLSGEYAKDGTAYHFHTNILAVNRTLHEEAEQCLYKNNIFVVISYKWANFEGSLLDLVPVVSSKNVGRMKHHSLRFHTTLTASKTRTHRMGLEVEQNRLEPPVRSLLMLAEDLKALCRNFQLRLFWCQGGVIYIASLPHQPLSLRVSPRSLLAQPSALFELRDTPYRAITPDLQRRLLLPFHDLVADDQRVSIRGAIADPLGVESTMSFMRPSIVFGEAKAWALYSVTAGYKAACDNLVLDGSYESASKAYGSVLPSVSAVLAPNLFPTAVGVPTGANLAISVLLVEIGLSLAWLALREGDLPHAVAVLNGTRMAKALSGPLRHAIPRQCTSAYLHLDKLVKLYAPRGGGMTIERLAQDLELLSMGDPDDEYVKHDVRMVMDAMDPDGLTLPSREQSAALKLPTRTLEEPAISLLPLKSCSALQMKPRIYDSTSGGKVPKKPDSVVGWQDTAHMASLSVDDKAAIHKLQKDRGFKATSFD